MVGRRARKSMSGAANDSTTKFPISGKVPLEWLMHRLGSPNPGHAYPCVATVQLGGVSRPSNVRASARPMSQLRASCIELSSRIPLQCRPLVVVVPKGCDRDPVLRT
ncbi:hypothetical protein V6N13_116736 [Hibiscus sabdariffa]